MIEDLQIMGKHFWRLVHTKKLLIFSPEFYFSVASGVLSIDFKILSIKSLASWREKMLRN